MRFSAVIRLRRPALIALMLALVLLLCGAVFALPREKWMFEDA